MLLLWTEVVCAECSATTLGEYARWGKRSAREVKKELSEVGWILSGFNAFCSRKCFKDFEEDKDHE